MSVYTKLNEAREKFHSLKLEKTGHNKFAGYNYFELGDFLIPALRVFKECGLCAIVSFDKDVATMTIHDTDVNGTALCITSPMGSAALKGCHEVQNIGAVETYQRRYLWVAALEIVEHDALDASAGPDKKPEPAPRSAAAKDALRESFESLQPEVQDRLRKFAPTMAMTAKKSAADAIQGFGMFCDELADEDPIELKKAVWFLLDSTTRSAIKRAEES